MPRKMLTTASHEPREKYPAKVEVILAIRKPRQHANRCAPTEDLPNSESRARIPRITRLMALAIKFEDLVKQGEVRDYADLARLGYVTRARMTQIMNLLMLAPDIQETLLCRIGSATTLREGDLRPVANLTLWSDQRILLQQIMELPIPSAVA